MTLKCLIVDDEPLARRVLDKYIATLSSLELVKECASAMEAAAYLHAHPVDVMFLDIKMPELTGLEFLKTLKDPPKVILTTAYSEYALEGYEYSVVDYLLKPISFERFLKAVNKVMPGIEVERHEGVAAAPSEADDFIFLHADKAEHKIQLSQIRYIEGCGNFVKVHSDDQMIMTSGTMAAMEEHLPKDRFLRVHKSYIVSIGRIDRIEGNMVRMGKETIPVGAYYKQALERMMERHRLKR